MSDLETVKTYYDHGFELDRLEQEHKGRLEKLRTLDILERFLPPAPATVLDVGGAGGAYALPLARKGYRVHLVDLVPLHVKHALARSAGQPETPLASATVGDARRLEFEDGIADAVLLFGPLYHLTQSEDRLRALSEARRCLRPGGVLAAAAIGRFAPLLDALRENLLEDPDFLPILRQDLEDGQHRSPEGRLDYFTTAYFHKPDDLGAELSGAGFRDVKVLGVEGPAWLMASCGNYLDREDGRQLLLDLMVKVEAEPALLGVSAHLLALGQR